MEIRQAPEAPCLLCNHAGTVPKLAVASDFEVKKPVTSNPSLSEQLSLSYHWDICKELVLLATSVWVTMPCHPLCSPSSGSLLPPAPQRREKPQGQVLSLLLLLPHLSTPSATEMSKKLPSLLAEISPPLLQILQPRPSLALGLVSKPLPSF